MLPSTCSGSGVPLNPYGSPRMPATIKEKNNDVNKKNGKERYWSIKHKPESGEILALFCKKTTLDWGPTTVHG